MNLDLRTKKTIEEGIESCETTHGVRIVEYSPGNGTRYVLSLVELHGFSPETSEWFGFDPKGFAWLVTWLNHSPMTSMVVVKDDGALLHWIYLREKLNAGVPDAIVLAEVIGYITGRSYFPCEEFEAAEKPVPCCERDHNMDGDCDRHPRV